MIWAALTMYGPAALVFAVFALASFLPARPPKPPKHRAGTLDHRPFEG